MGGDRERSPPPLLPSAARSGRRRPDSLDAPPPAPLCRCQTAPPHFQIAAALAPCAATRDSLPPLFPSAARPSRRPPATRRAAREFCCRSPTWAGSVLARRPADCAALLPRSTAEPRLLPPSREHRLAPSRRSPLPDRRRVRPDCCAPELPLSPGAAESGCPAADRLRPPPDSGTCHCPGRHRAQLIRDHLVDWHVCPRQESQIARCRCTSSCR